MSYHTTINGARWSFADLKTLLSSLAAALRRYIGRRRG